MLVLAFIAIPVAVVVVSVTSQKRHVSSGTQAPMRNLTGPRFCTQCGERRLSNDARYCTQCGASYGESMARTPTSQ
jgi:hypothetical protein